MYEQLVQNTLELNKAARQLRMLGGFDEIRKLAKKWLVSWQDTEDFIKGKRYCLQDAGPGNREYAGPMEKLYAEMAALDDPLFADIIAGHLIGKCSKELFAEKVSIGHKTLQKCLDFIMEKGFHAAEEQAKLKGKNGVERNTVMAFSDAEVFAWAEEYYTLDDTKEDARKAEENRKKILEDWALKERKTVAVKKSGNKKAASKKSGPQKEKQGNPAEKAEKTGDKKEIPADGQMSMFDILSQAS